MREFTGTVEELRGLLELLKAARADCDAFHNRAQDVEKCLQRLSASDTQANLGKLGPADGLKIADQLLQEFWFAKESSELRLAANLHTRL